MEREKCQLKKLPNYVSCFIQKLDVSVHIEERENKNMNYLNF